MITKSQLIDSFKKRLQGHINNYIFSKVGQCSVALVLPHTTVGRYKLSPFMCLCAFVSPPPREQVKYHLDSKKHKKAKMARHLTHMQSSSSLSMRNVVCVCVFICVYGVCEVQRG